MLNKTVFSMAKISWGGILLFVDLIINPTFSLFFIVLGAVILDFITGITKAKFKNVERTSEGFRKTVVKLMQYTIPIFVLWVGSKRVPGYEATLKQICGWLMLFILYIEVTSIFENLYEIDKTSTISKFLYKPVLKILKFGIEHNPVVDAANKVDEKENPTT